MNIHNIASSFRRGAVSRLNAGTFSGRGHRTAADALASSLRQTPYPSGVSPTDPARP